MFDVGWPELLVIAVVMIVVVGPKDLPRMLRTFGKTMARVRSVAGDFRRQFDEALREADLDDVKTTVDQFRGLDPRQAIRRELDPIAKVGQEVRSGLDQMMKPKPATPSVALEAEPVKTAAVPMPGGEPLAAPPPLLQPAEPPQAVATVHEAAPVKTAATEKPKAAPRKSGTASAKAAAPRAKKDSAS